MDINEIRAKRLREVIEKSGYTYAELEKLTGFSKSSLQRYATGETTKVPLNCFEKVAAVTGANLRYLLVWDDSPIEDKQAHLANVVGDTHPEGLTGATKILIGGAVQKVREEKSPRISFDTREEAIQYFKSLPEADFEQLEVFAEYLTYRRTRPPE